MWREIEPDETRAVAVGPHQVMTYSFGSGDKVLFCLNGGPGLPCDYVRDSHAWLVDHGYRVVAFDQLGTGKSDQPTDPALWTITRYVDEVEAVRRALDLGSVHLLGQSWGGWLAIEFALTHPEAIRTLILENTCADIPHALEEVARLRGALGPETVATMLRHEAEGTLDHPAYQGVVALLNYRHICRLDQWPAPLQRSIAGWNQGPYKTIQGANEFVFTGNLKNWNRVADLPRITAPVLITVGQHDVLTPACAMRMRDALPDAELKVFANSSHLPFFEEPELFFPALLDFLDRRGGPSPGSQ